MDSLYLVLSECSEPAKSKNEAKIGLVLDNPGSE